MLHGKDMAVAWTKCFFYIFLCVCSCMNCVCFKLVQWPQRDSGDMGCEDILACVNLDAAP